MNGGFFFLGLFLGILLLMVAVLIIYYKQVFDDYEDREAQLQFPTKANPRLYHAYLLKEALRLALKVGQKEIFEALTKWMAWAQRC